LFYILILNNIFEFKFQRRFDQTLGSNEFHMNFEKSEHEFGLIKLIPGIIGKSHYSKWATFGRPITIMAFDPKSKQGMGSSMVRAAAVSANLARWRQGEAGPRC
jgi:hypothetical protein